LEDVCYDAGMFSPFITDGEGKVVLAYEAPEEEVLRWEGADPVAILEGSPADLGLGGKLKTWG
jgi:hypothetical protein